MCLKCIFSLYVDSCELLLCSYMVVVNFSCAWIPDSVRRVTSISGVPVWVVEAWCPCNSRVVFFVVLICLCFLFCFYS